ncbi:sigma-70 family RNA polymerase sigma factor [Rathayibacter festucae]|uniref:RNA polymerase sigma factor n=1 Tax=Rathayibacter festucae TaxID=110937 RepID=UPI002A6A788D|nr:sigma-70 family RNA polymerase sigma factor [Rathayibacter festucae]MDY0912295.1 sigma-70 family RNA polymerase sigma factor [Rathayibacter festucae]
MTTARDRLRARFEALVELNGDALLSYFLRRSETREDAADLLSETLLTAWRRVRSIPAEEEGARMWMFGVARNTLSNHRRGQVRHRLLSEKLAQDLAIRPAPVDSDTALTVREAIDRLPDESAELVRLVHWDGFSIAEAAALMKVPAPTARARYGRARLLLRTELADQAVDVREVQ